MKLDKILFVGLGGAGQRHLRIFNEKLGDATRYLAYRRTNKTPLLNPDFTVDSSQELTDKFDIKVSNDYDSLLAESPDLVVISTPTSMHIDAIKKAVENGANVLVEKPFSHSLIECEEVFNVAKEKNLRVLTSYQRRYNPPFSKIKEYIEKNTDKVITAHFNTFSHVPDWHKYEDFKELYACRKDLGGGVLLTEIHEIDLCCWFFGLPEYVYCVGGNKSYEKLDIEDTITMVLSYKNFSISFSMSFMAKACERNFTIKTYDGEVHWTENGNKLVIKENESLSEEEFSSFNMNNMFENQAEYIINSENEYLEEDAELALNSLKVVEAAKKSMMSLQRERV